MEQHKFLENSMYNVLKCTHSCIGTDGGNGKALSTSDHCFLEIQVRITRDDLGFVSLDATPYLLTSTHGFQFSQ